jgi:hypothetical protein
LAVKIAKNVICNNLRVVGVGAVDSEMKSSEVGGSSSGDNRLDAIVASEIRKKLLGASFLFDSDVSELVLKVIMGDDEIFFENFLDIFGFVT